MKVLVRPVFPIADSPLVQKYEKETVRLLRSIDDEIYREYNLEETFASQTVQIPVFPEMARLEAIKSDIRYQLMPILFVFNGDLRGRSILDLGCGSPFTMESPYPRFFEPWLCRVLAHLGADVTGVDLHPAPTEKYRHLQRDLSSPGALNGLPAKSIEAVNAAAFFDAPSLIRNIQPYQVIRQVKEEIEVILKEDGVIICDSRICHEFSAEKIFFPPQ